MAKELTKSSKKSPFLQYDFMVDGKRYCGSTKTGDKAKAEKFARTIRRRAMDDAVLKRVAGPSHDMTWADALAAYLADSDQNAESRANDDRYFPWLTARIGNETLISTIDDGMLRDLMTERKAMIRFGREHLGPVSPATVNTTVLMPLRKVLRYAVNVRKVRLPQEPFYKSHRLKEEPRVAELMMAEELQLERFRDDFWPVCAFILLSGLRRSSAILRWDQVHWQEGIIRIKTKGARTQDIPITPAMELLLRNALGKNDEYVWTFKCRHAYTVRATGEVLVKGLLYPVTFTRMNRLWGALCRDAGVKNITIHDLRKTMGARMIRATGDLAVVARALNHKDPRVTILHYMHITHPDIRKRMIETENETMRLRSIQVPVSQHETHLN